MVPTTTEGAGREEVKRKKEGKVGKVSKRKDKSSEPDKAGRRRGSGRSPARVRRAADGWCVEGTKAKTHGEHGTRRYYEQVKVDGEVFNRGDCAYVIGDKTRDLDDDELEPCGACGECGEGTTSSRV